MISGNRLISWMLVGGAFLTGLATTVFKGGFGGGTTSFTCEVRHPDEPQTADFTVFLEEHIEG